MRFAPTTALVLAVCTIVGVSCEVADAADCKGVWSAWGQQPHVGDSFTSDAIASPNKQNTLTISEDAIVFTGASGKQVKLDVPVNTALMEVVWSQDSSGFAINESDATNEGPWQTYIYRVEGALGVPRSIPIDPAITRAVSELARCDANAPTNVAVMALASDGKEAIVVAETPALDICKTKKGSFVGFRVSADSGKLIQHVTSVSLQEKWPDALGCRLQK